MKTKEKLPLGYSRIESKNCLRLRFTYDGHRIDVYGKSVAECETKKLEKIAFLKQRRNLDNLKVTLDNYYHYLWIPERAKSVKQSTLYSYSKPWKYISEYLGSLKVVDLQKADVIGLMEHVATKSGSQKTANNVLRLLRQLLSSAVSDRIILFNPASTVKPYRVDNRTAQNGNHRVLSDAEIQIFLRNAQDCHYYNLFRFLLYTGVRVGEALALNVFDVHEKEITISKTVTRLEKGFVLSDTPKTASSNRVIPVTESVEKIIQDQKRQNQLLECKESWLFPNSRGQMANFNNVNICISNVIRRINESGTEFAPFSVHSFRATFCTRAVTSGVIPSSLKELLGHSNIRTTLNFYARTSLDTRTAEMSKIDYAI